MDVLRGLSYPFGHNQFPEEGKVQEVAPGVHWLHMPLPFSLNRINLWLLADGDGWTVVDTGMDLPYSRDIWEELFVGHLQGKPIKRVIVTHMHPDHVGLAGWLCERFDCELWMSRTEFLMCRNLISDTGREAPEAAINFYKAAGFPEEALEKYRDRFGEFGRHIVPLPDSFYRVTDGETFEINGHYWQVIIGAGHSPAHVCLYCPALKVFITGDQVIPRISSNVSVFPTEPKGDPLSEWLNSGHKIRAAVPGNVLVLPAHQEPFYGLHTRLAQILSSHNKGLNRLFDHLSEPRRVVDCFPALFKRKIEGINYMLATGETLAHLNCLISQKRIVREMDDDGVNWYRQLSEASHEDE